MARRMTALLERKPRHRKTRAYLETLPKRKKLVVSPEDFVASPVRDIRFIAEPIEARLIARASDGTVIARFVRKDKRRPRARQEGECHQLTKSEAIKAPPRWSCRPEGRWRQNWMRQRSEKLDRTLALTMHQRFVLYVAQEGLCALCGESMFGAAFGYSLDHVIPRSLDGADGIGNLVLCHGECNGRKTNDTPTGCEMVALLAVNCRLGVQPQRF
jgi:5-methylcytosine-specific restriction endonuclease McrA